MRAYLLLPFAAAVALAAPAAPPPEFELVSVKKIWDAGAHNAFTDLIRFQDRWYCTFREAEDHVGGDGRIRILTSNDGDKWESAALLAEDGIDLRDPKLSITPDNRLMIVAGGSVYGGTKILKSRQPRVLFSADGRTWTKPQPVLGNGDWLWRVVWHKGKAYGVSYDHTRARPGDEPIIEGRGAPEWHIKLVTSDNGVDWRMITVMPVTGRPNETTIRFLADDRCVALIRREGPEPEKRSAWLGVAAPPYTDWRFREADHQLGGPNFIVLPDGELVAGGRDYRKSPKNTTAIGPLSFDYGYKPQLQFPSAGDNSYPGFVWHNGQLWMSYYSSHEGKTSIYLAHVKRRARLVK